MNIIFTRYTLLTGLILSSCIMDAYASSSEAMDIENPDVVHASSQSNASSLNSSQDDQVLVLNTPPQTRKPLSRLTKNNRKRKRILSAEPSVHEANTEPSRKRPHLSLLNSQDESEAQIDGNGSSISNSMDVADEPMNAGSAERVNNKVVRNVPQHWKQLKKIVGKNIVKRRAGVIARLIPKDVKNIRSKVEWCCKNLSKMNLEYRCVEFLSTIVKSNRSNYIYTILRDLRNEESINDIEYGIFISQKSKEYFKGKLKAAIERNLTREELSSKFGETASVLYPNLNFNDNTFIRHIRNFFKQDFVNRYCQYLFNPLPHKGKEDIPVIDMVREFMNDPSNHLVGGYRIICRKHGTTRNTGDGSLQEAFLRTYGHMIQNGDIAATTFKTAYNRLKKKKRLTKAAINFYESCKSKMSIEEWNARQRKRN